MIDHDLLLDNPLSPIHNPIMSDDARSTRLAKVKYSIKEQYGGLSLWKRLLVMLSVVLVGVGVTSSMFAPSKPAPAPSLQVDNQTNLTGEEVRVKVEETGHWFSSNVAPYLWRIGISFLIAFIIGFLMRQFLVAMAFTLGAILAVLFVVNYLGWIEISPDVRSTVSNSAEQVEIGTRSFVEVMKARLPSSFASIAGFFIGFLRKRW